MARSYFKNIFLYLLIVVLGPRGCEGFYLVAVTGGYSLVSVLGLLPAVASFIAEHGV